MPLPRLLLQDLVEHRENESRGLSRAGLRDSYQVVPGQDFRESPRPG
jgi:hypothetical protein